MQEPLELVVARPQDLLHDFLVAFGDCRKPDWQDRVFFHDPLDRPVVHHGVLPHDPILDDWGTAHHAGQTVTGHRDQLIAPATNAQGAECLRFVFLYDAIEIASLVHGYTTIFRSTK